MEVRVQVRRKVYGRVLAAQMMYYMSRFIWQKDSFRIADRSFSNFAVVDKNGGCNYSANGNGGLCHLAVPPDAVLLKTVTNNASFADRRCRSAGYRLSGLRRLGRDIDSDVGIYAGGDVTGAG